MKLESIVEEVDSTGESTGIELDATTSSASDSSIVEPFDPESIDVITRTMTVDLLLARTQSRMIDLHPDFQRTWGIWDNKRQSRLIESLLLRIPLPVLYAAEDRDERWEIVDGIQRLSTIARFLKPEIINSQALTLSGLEYLTDYEGKKFSDLSPRLQMRLRETELLIHLIRRGTPSAVKFNIFARINTGGMILSHQELRHAIVPGKARSILKDWAGSKPFRIATSNSIRSKRMTDRELILRFVAFYCLGVDRYTNADMDGFLISAMRHLDDVNDASLRKMKKQFDSAMWTAYGVFGTDAFRKRFQRNHTRHPINKALFETISVNLANLSPSGQDRLKEIKNDVQEALMDLCNNRPFESAISQGTGDVTKVRRRFSDVHNMFGRVLSDD